MKQPKPEEKIERNACLSDRLRGGLSEGLAAKALIKEMAEEMTAIKLNAQFIDLFKFGLITGNQSN